MINTTLQKKIIATLGKHYSGKVIEYLNKQQVYNQKGEPFSSGSIRNIVNGRENLQVEKHIIDLVAIAQRDNKKLKTKKSKIIKTR